MKIEKWCPPGDQMAQLRNQHWTVARLVMLSKDLEVFEIPLNHLNLYYYYDSLTLRKMVMLMNGSQLKLSKRLKKFKTPSIQK